MIDGLWIALYTLIVLLVGLAGGAVLRWRTPHDSNRLASASLAIAFGFGLLPWMLLMLSMAGIKPSRGIIGGIGVAAAMILVFRFKFSRVGFSMRRQAGQSQNDSRETQLAWYAMPALALIGVQAVLLFSLSLLPTHDYDALAVWALKGHQLFLRPLSPLPEYFTDVSLSFTHLDYPLLVSMLWAGAYTMQGHTDEVLSRTILLLPTILIATLAYSFARPRLGRSLALIVTALSIGSFITTRWAAQGLADQVLAMWILAATVALVRFIESQRTADALLAASLAAFAAWTKLEGSVLLAIVTLLLASMLLWQPNRRAALGGLIFATIVYTPWAIFFRRLPHTHENYQDRLGPAGVLHHLNRLPELAHEAWANFLVWVWWPIFALLIVSLVLSPRALRRPSVICVWLILLGHVAADICAYLVTPWNLHELLPFTLERLLLQLTPLAVLLATLHWESLRAPPPSAHPPSLDRP